MVKPMLASNKKAGTPFEVRAENESANDWQSRVDNFVMFQPVFAENHHYKNPDFVPRSDGTPRELRVNKNINKAKARRLRYRRKRSEARWLVDSDDCREFNESGSSRDTFDRVTKALFSKKDPPVHATRLALRAFLRDYPRMRIPVLHGHLGDVFQEHNGASIPVREVLRSFELVYASPLRARRQRYREIGSAEAHGVDWTTGIVQADDPGSDFEIEVDETSDTEATPAESIASESVFMEAEDGADPPPKVPFGKLSCPGCGGALYAHNEHCTKCHVRTEARQIREMYEQYGGSEIFTVLLKVMMFMRQNTATDKGLVLLDVAREYGRESVERSADIIQRVAEILLPLREYWQSVATNGDAVQSGDTDESFVGTFHSWIKMTRALGNTRVKGILTALYSLLSIGLAAKCGEAMTADHIADAVNTCTNLYKAASPFEAILHGLDNFVNLVRSVCKDGWQGLTNWLKPARGIGEVELLITEILHLNSTYKQMTYAQRADFRQKVVKADHWYKENEGWIKNCPVRDFNLKDRGMRIFGAINDAKTTLAFFEHANNREKPFTVVFCGGTDIGKSCVQYRTAGVIMAAAYGKNIPVEDMHDLVYYWPLGSKFADGLHAGVGAVIIDDMAAKHPNKQPEGDPAIALLHALSNIAPFFPNSANAPDKGKIPCHPAGTIISTNISSLNVIATFQEAGIIYRRINHFVSIRPKKGYSDDGVLSGKRAAAWNKKAIEEEMEQLEDWWDVQVHTFHVTNVTIPPVNGGVPKPRIEGYWEKIFPLPLDANDKSDAWAPIEDYWFFLGESAVNHFAAQTAHVNEMKTRKVNFAQYTKPRPPPGTPAHAAAMPVPPAPPPLASGRPKKPPPKGPPPDGDPGFKPRGKDAVMGDTDPRPPVDGVVEHADSFEERRLAHLTATREKWGEFAYDLALGHSEALKEQIAAGRALSVKMAEAQNEAAFDLSYVRDEDPEAMVMGGRPESGDPPQSGDGNIFARLLQGLRGGFHAGVGYQRRVPPQAIEGPTIFTEDGPKPSTTPVDTAFDDARWARWGTLGELPPGESPPEAAQRWWRRFRFAPTGNGTQAWDMGVFKDARNFLPGMGPHDHLRRDSPYEEATTDGQMSTLHQRDVKLTALTVYDLTRIRGLMAKETGVLGFNMLVGALTGGYLVFATFNAIGRGRPVAAILNYAMTMQNIWTSGWALGANAALFLNCAARTIQAVQGPLDQVVHRLNEYNAFSDKVRKWAKEHSAALKILMGVVFTLMVYLGYKKCWGSKIPLEFPADDHPQSAEALHRNEGIGGYTDFGGSPPKLPPGVACPRAPVALTEEERETREVAERYAAKMAGLHGVRKLFERRIVTNTYVTGLYDVNFAPILGSAGQVTFINSSHFVVNAHVVRERSQAKWMRLVREPQAGAPGEKIDIPLGKIMFTGVPDEDGVRNRDVLIGKLVEVSMKNRLNDLVPFLPKSRIASSLRVNLLGKTGTAHYDGEATRNLIDYRMPDGKARIVSAGTRYGSVETIANTARGDCGRVYYSGGPDNVTDPPLIVGIHTGVNNFEEGKQKILLITPLHGVADIVLNGFSFENVQQGNPAHIHNLGASLPLGPVHKKDVVGWLSAPESELEHPVDMVVYGDWGGFRSENRTRVRENMIWKHVDMAALNEAAGEDISDGKVPPAFKDHTDAGCPKYKQAQFLSLVPSATPPPWDEKVYQDLKEAANLYLEELTEHESEWKPLLRKLSLEEAINGVKGERGIDSLNFGSSAGHPFYCKKNQLFSMRPDGTRGISEELRLLVEMLEEGLQKGELCPVFASQLKDEAISFAKDAIGKYRVFQMSPVDFTIVTRMYGLSFVRVMQLFPYMFGACVGMNATCEQWTQMAHFLGVGQGHVDIFDGDYINFDKSMRPEVTRCVRELIVDLHRDVYSKQDLTTLDNVLKVTFSPVVNYFGTVLKFKSVNPSGGGLTTQNNCGANNIFVRYAWIQHYGPSVGNRRAGILFRRCCHLVTYGDDILVGIDTIAVPFEFVEKAGKFSCRTMQATLSRIGIQFTDAAKNTVENTVDYTPHDKISFLKRLFVLADVPGWGYDKQYTAPLDKRSLIKMLHYTMEKSTVAPLDVLKSTLQSLGIESYFQGPKFFECMRLTVLKALERYSEKEFHITVEDFIFAPYEKHHAWYVATVNQSALYADPCNVSPGNVYPVERDRGPDLISMPASLAQARNLDQCVAYFDTVESGDPPPDDATVVLTAGTAPQGARRSDQSCVGSSVPRTDNTLPENKKKQTPCCGTRSGDTPRELRVNEKETELQMGDPLTRFYDAGQERTEELPGNPDSSFDTGDMPDYTLANWLEARPVKIATITWNENTDLVTTLKPWSLYYSNPDIYKKLQGFCRLRSRLKVKLILSASPFQYSMGIMSYKPLGDDTTTDAFCGGMNGLAKHPMAQEALLSVHTTRPHAYFYPQFSRGCEMSLPFLYYKNWIQLDSNLQELDDMGTISIFSVRPLRSATGISTVQPVTVSVYAWAEDVHLSGPSYTLQSGDPPLYTVRPSLINNLATPGEPGHVEKIALDSSNSVSCDSAVVGAAGDQMSFKSIMDRDVIIANIDWNAVDPTGKVLLIQNVTPCVTWRAYVNEFDQTLVSGTAMQMTPSAHLATAFNWWDGPITYNLKAVASQVHRGKLALSYEPDGFKGTWDESSLIAPRMVTKIWDIANDPEFEITVPMVASKAYLQTGRMREAVVGLNTTYKRPTLPTGNVNVYKPANYNGALILSVINPLTSSDPSAGVGIIVTMNARGVNFSEPTELDMPFSMYELQSGDGEEGTLANEPDVSVEVAAIVAKEVRAPYVYMGETVDHLLPLLKRTTKYRSVRLTQYEQKPNDFYTRFTPELSVTKTIAAKTLGTTFMQPMLPLGTGTLGELTQDEFTEGVIVGPDTAGNPPATKIISGQTERLNTPTAYFSSSYVGWRGSHVYKAKVAKGNKVDGPKFNEFSLSRCTSPLAIIFEKLWTHMPAITHWSNGNVESDLEGVGAMAALLAKSRKPGDMINQGSAGMTQTNVEEIPFSEAEFPYYSSYRMMPANPTANYKIAFRPDGLSWNHFDTAKYEYQTWSNWCLRSVVQYAIPTSNMLVHEHPEVQLYHSAGHDFTLLQYVNVPTMYCYNFAGQNGTGVLPEPWWVA